MYLQCTFNLKILTLLVCVCASVSVCVCMCVCDVCVGNWTKNLTYDFCVFYNLDTCLRYIYFKSTHYIVIYHFNPCKPLFIKNDIKSVIRHENWECYQVIRNIHNICNVLLKDLDFIFTVIYTTYIVRHFI